MGSLHRGQWHGDVAGRANKRRPRRSRLRAPGWARALGPLFAAVLALGACRGAPEADFADRLWVSTMPGDAREPFFAMLVTGARKRHVGVLHAGSLYAGRWELFAFKRKNAKSATFEFLQSGARHEVQFVPCKPKTGFAYCVELQGDPTGVRRWYSKKRWALRRKSSADATGELERLREAQTQLVDTVAATLEASAHDRTP